MRQFRSVLISICYIFQIIYSEYSNELEIFVRKYRALGYSDETNNIKNYQYKFRFCICDTETFNPPSTPGCACTQTLYGKTVRNSMPQVLFSSSCMLKPDLNKCLIGRLTNIKNKDNLYTSISVETKSLTYPRYQKIPLLKFKNTVALQCSKTDSCENCLPCKTGLILMNYVILSENSAVHKTKQPSMIKPSEPKIVRLNQVAKNLQTSYRKPLNRFRKNLKDTQLMNRRKSSELDNKVAMKEIKNELLKHSLIFRILPMQFNVNRFKNMLLHYHNKYRSKHGARPLYVNYEIEQSAESYANKLVKVASCLKHDPVRKYGENLFYYASYYLPDEETLAAMIAKSFYLEAHGYNYKTYENMDYSKTGHFTQMIWKASSSIGIGMAIHYSSGRSSYNCAPRFDAHLIYIVVRYDPPGNIQSLESYQKNVAPPLKL